MCRTSDRSSANCSTLLVSSLEDIASSSTASNLEDPTALICHPNLSILVLIMELGHCPHCSPSPTNKPARREANRPRDFGGRGARRHVLSTVGLMRRFHTHATTCLARGTACVENTAVFSASGRVPQDQCTAICTSSPNVAPPSEAVQLDNAPTLLTPHNITAPFRVLT